MSRPLVIDAAAVLSRSPVKRAKLRVDPGIYLAPTPGERRFRSERQRGAPCSAYGYAAFYLLFVTTTWCWSRTHLRRLAEEAFLARTRGDHGAEARRLQRAGSHLATRISAWIASARRSEARLEYRAIENSTNPSATEDAVKSSPCSGGATLVRSDLFELHRRIWTNEILDVRRRRGPVLASLTRWRSCGGRPLQATAAHLGGDRGAAPTAPCRSHGAAVATRAAERCLKNYVINLAEHSGSPSSLIFSLAEMVFFAVGRRRRSCQGGDWRVAVEPAAARDQKGASGSRWSSPRDWSPDHRHRHRPTSRTSRIGALPAQRERRS